MKIDRIEVYGYDLSYRYGTYVMSGNQVINSIPSTVVRIITDSGIEGWGEVCPLGPLYLASHGLGARAALQQMLPALKGLDPTNLASVHEAMNASLRGHSYAKSAVLVGNFWAERSISVLMVSASQEAMFSTDKAPTPSILRTCFLIPGMWTF